MPCNIDVDKFDRMRDKKRFPIDIVLKWKYLGKLDKFSVFLFKEDNENVYVRMGFFKNNEFQNVTQLELSVSEYNQRRGFIDYVYVSKAFRGKKLATKLYAYLITKHDYVLISGASQSPGGKHIWRELSKISGIDISLSIEDGSKATSRKFRNGRYEIREWEDDDAIRNRRFIAKKSLIKTIRYL